MARYPVSNPLDLTPTRDMLMSAAQKVKDAIASEDGHRARLGLGFMSQTLAAVVTHCDLSGQRLPSWYRQAEEAMEVYTAQLASLERETREANREAKRKALLRLKGRPRRVKSNGVVTRLIRITGNLAEQRLPEAKDNLTYAISAREAYIKQMAELGAPVDPDRMEDLNLAVGIAHKVYMGLLHDVEMSKRIYRLTT